MKALHKALYDEFDGVCAGCGGIFDETMVCAHHIRSRKSRPDLTLETENCILVCNTPSKANNMSGCHNRIHTGHFKVVDRQITKNT